MCSNYETNIYTCLGLHKVCLQQCRVNALKFTKLKTLMRVRHVKPETSISMRGFQMRMVVRNGDTKSKTVFTCSCSDVAAMYSVLNLYFVHKMSPD